MTKETVENIIEEIKGSLDSGDESQIEYVIIGNDISIAVSSRQYFIKLEDEYVKASNDKLGTVYISYDSIGCIKSFKLRPKHQPGILM